MSPLIPGRLETICRHDGNRSEWLNRLPSVLQHLQQQWSLTFDAPFEEVTCAWVGPVILKDASAAVLKLGMPHMEAEHEIDGLRFWNGNPTVRLLKADDGLNAMLLERCEPGTPLRASPESEQDVVIAKLLRCLWRPPAPPHHFRPLSEMLEYWSGEALLQSARWADPGLVSEGLRLFAALPKGTPEELLLATDLHAGNVLRAQREPWLVIDPKPFLGDPAFDATQHLFNCQARLRSDPNETISRFAGLLGLDQDRVRLWTFARAAVQAGMASAHTPWIELARALANPLQLKS